MSVIRSLWAYPFMVNAFRAGTVVAVLAAVMGWFTVLRRQTFAGHTLAMVSFPGAAFATLLGVAPGLGYFGFCVGAAGVLAVLGPRETGHDAALTGTVQSALLACGYLFVALYKGFLGGVDSLLFGSFLGITDAQVVTLALIAAAALGALAIMGRPLLLASVDPAVAAARGVPVRALSAAFMVLLGAATAGASQITGSLLVFALLVVPAATAQQLTARPGLGLALSVVIALAVVWTGLAAAYYTPYPIGFHVTSIAFACYVLARLRRLAGGPA
ncbi:metal ABC transporter permease [Streptomyces sp. TS71-3]|uniref:metal ABC transporter permease n=1 Tax=Streptomyces sp. TS71-3 TaxID=2733862 RepID=UPI001AFD3778|nr:metal ABC transporter permease [Streptomyces sp. TS71-3]GHJ41226.1 ABC transporter permease [Streptomyces sp. TS71-3]